MSLEVDIKKLFLFLAVIALFTGGITIPVFADGDDDDDDDNDSKKSKTLEQHCAKKKGFDKLVCEAIFSIQIMLGMIKDDVSELDGRVNTLETQTLATQTLHKQLFVERFDMNNFEVGERGHFEYRCPNNGIMEGHDIERLFALGDIGINVSNGFYENVEVFDGFHGLEFDATRTGNGASVAIVTAYCISLE